MARIASIHSALKGKSISNDQFPGRFSSERPGSFQTSNDPTERFDDKSQMVGNVLM